MHKNESNHQFLIQGRSLQFGLVHLCWNHVAMGSLGGAGVQMDGVDGLGDATAEHQTHDNLHNHTV